MVIPPKVPAKCKKPHAYIKAASTFIEVGSIGSLGMGVEALRL